MLTENCTANRSGRRCLPPFPHETLQKLFGGESDHRMYAKSFGSAESLRREADLRVSQILLFLGFIPKSNSFYATKAACLLIFENRGYVENLKNLLYPEVARRLNSQPCRVEQQVRSALAHSCGTRKIRNINDLFEMDLIGKRENISCREFFGYIDLLLRMDFGID